MAAIDVVGLTKRYEEKTALDTVDISFPTGTVHGLLGPNGAGKTTLLRCLLGLVTPDAGTVSLLGRPGAADLTGVGGFLGTPSFYPYLSARENLVVLAALDGGGADVDGTLARVGLEDRARQKVSALSSGLRQRLALASALLRNPALLVLDEPGNSLDPAGLAFLHGLIRSLRAEGTGVLLCSHDLAEVGDLCDTVTVLNEGRVVLEAGVAELREQAGHDVHTVLTSDDNAAATVLAADVEVEWTRHGLLVRGPETAVDAWVLAVAARGVAVRSMVVERASLTDLFLRLTGRPA